MSKSLIHTLEKPEKDIFIYGLCDPDTGEIRYIGLTTSGFKRLYDHYGNCYKRSNRGTLSRSKTWIRSLKDAHKIFQPIYLEYFDNDGPWVDEAEIFWISYFKMLGSNLVNHEIGGRSKYLRFNSKENRRKLSEANKISNGTPEKREFFRQNTKKQWQNPEIREKRLAGMKNKPRTEKQKENMKMGNTQRIILKDDLGNIYNSMPEAAKALDVTSSTIHKALFGAIKICKGRILTKISGGIIENPKMNIHIKKDRKPIENKIKDQYGNIYLNITEACKITKVSLRVIHRILKGEIKNPRAGYIFEYVRV